MKNILMLTTELFLGGAEKVFYDHTIAFSKHYNVHVCLFDKSRIYEGFVLDLPIYELDDDKSITNPASKWVHRRKRLKQIIETHQIDVCISHMEGPNYLNCLAKSSCKKILVAHGSIKVNPQKSPIAKWFSLKLLIPYLYNKANKLVTVSQDLKKEHEEVGVKENKVVCINNFFEVDRIIEWMKEKTMIDAVLENHTFLINVGRLANQKNQRFLIDLIKHLRQKGHKEKLLIVGEGTLKSELVAQAKSLGLKVFVNGEDTHVEDETDVLFMGAHRNPYQFIAKAKLFVLSSFNEGFPLVLGESLACSVPIVAVDCPTGPRELLSKTGLFSEEVKEYKTLDYGNLVRYFTEDKEADLKVWEAAVENLLDDEKGYASKKENCLSKALQYDKPIIVAKWRQLIDSLTS